jgi:hypothetical protein
VTTQFITNVKGEKTAVIIPIAEYEELLHQRHLNLELTDEYKTLMDTMLEKEDNGIVEYVSFKSIKDHFQNK